MKHWQLVQLSYNEEQEDGNTKVKKVNHLVEADTFIEAETRATELFAADYQDMKVLAIKKSKFSDILDKGGENWYGAKVIYTTTSDRGKDKHSSGILLIQASKLKMAMLAFEEFSAGWKISFELVSITKTNLADVWDSSFEQNNANDLGEENGLSDEELQQKIFDQQDAELAQLNQEVLQEISADWRTIDPKAKIIEEAEKEPISESV